MTQAAEYTFPARITAVDMRQVAGLLYLRCRELIGDWAARVGRRQILRQQADLHGGARRQPG